MVTERTFIESVSKWARDVETEALRLYQDGCAPEGCIRIAITVVEAKDMKRARVMGAIVAPRGLIL
jgi:hypothetical protein